MRPRPALVAALLLAGGCCSTAAAPAPAAASAHAESLRTAPARNELPPFRLAPFETPGVDLPHVAFGPLTPRVPLVGPQQTRWFVEGLGGCVLDRPDVPTILIPTVFAPRVSPPFEIEIVVVPPSTDE